MSDIIRLLPDSVANQIAAGEVIQRPASVIKELVENSIDAGAKHIDIAVTDAGKTMIQVVDDGKGMSPTDARMAFERHATSKIKEAVDLFALRTMGFRGEALASIAAVAQVELRTCAEGSELGTKIHIAASQVESQEATACPVGCNFMVKNLFYNVPARRKFLKSNQTELSNILTEVERIALVNPTVSFRVHHNDTELLNLTASALKQRIVAVCGKKMNQDLLSVNVETGMLHLHGYVGRKESARKKGAKQFFFVNGRYMKHPYFHKAVMECYEHLIVAGEQVPYFLYFEVDPNNIDVNIHPTKTEIKFENEQAIWQIISAAVREALGKFQAAPSIDFDTEGRPDIPFLDHSATASEYIPMPTTSYDPAYNPFDTPSSSSYAYTSKKTDWQPFFDGLDRKDAFPEDDMPDTTNEFGVSDITYDEVTKQSGSLYADSETAPTCKGAGQHFHHKNTYILTSVKSGLMVIDQHRAHVLILFNEYLERLNNKEEMASQRLLFPELIHFSPSELPVVEESMADLQALGFEISDLGNGTFSVNAVPAGAEKFNPETLLGEMIRSVAEKGTQIGDELKEILALSLAKSTAIATGQSLSREEVDMLVERLFALPTPNYTPDGKTVVTLLSDHDLGKFFGR